MAKVIKAPEDIWGGNLSKSVFLAGSIEMGVAENWQDRFQRAVADQDDVVIFNPRRDDWDSSWVQTRDNPQFRQQVEWELGAMAIARVIPVYFDPETKSPITLMELGIHSQDGKLIVCCPDKFWRKGNVDIVCEWHDIEQVNTLDDLIWATMERLAL